MDSTSLTYGTERQFRSYFSHRPCYTAVLAVGWRVGMFDTGYVYHLRYMSATYKTAWCSWEFQNFRLEHSVSVVILPL